jgi:hypothetical protein
MVALDASRSLESRGASVRGGGVVVASHIQDFQICFFVSGVLAEDCNCCYSDSDCKLLCKDVSEDGVVKCCP